MVIFPFLSSSSSRQFFCSGSHMHWCTPNILWGYTNITKHPLHVRAMFWESGSPATIMNNPHVPIMTDCKATAHQYVTFSILLLSSSGIPVYTWWGWSRRLQGIPKFPLDAHGTGSWLSQTHAWAVFIQNLPKVGHCSGLLKYFFILNENVD